MSPVLLCLLCLAAVLALARLADDVLYTDGEPKLIYTGPDAITFTVSADGLSSIQIDGRRIARGGWRVGNGDCIFRAGPNKVQAGPLIKKEIRILESNRAEVVHVQEDVVTTYEYVFEGEDVTIAARVENRNEKFPLNIVRFLGLELHFTTAPRGIYPGGGAWREYAALQDYRTACMHPGFYTRVGGTCLYDMDFGVGTTPLNTGVVSKTLFLWMPRPSAGNVDLDWTLEHFRHEPIPPGGARTFEMGLRLSTTTRWKHLLVPYRDHFVRTYGPIRYDADYRLMGVAQVSGAGEVNEVNPWGFRQHRHLHTRIGTEQFCDTVVAGLLEANAQGLLIWGQGGYEHRGEMFRADFDVLPPDVEQSWPILQHRLGSTGIRFGVCARPSQLHVRADWERDMTLRINPEDPQHLRMVWGRFKRMIDMGCTLFMLDSFGNNATDITIIQYLRKRMGAHIQTFAEHQFDAILPYTGGYSISEKWTPGDSGPTPGKWEPPPMLELWNIYQWLCPGINMLARRYDISGKPERVQQEFNFCYSNRLTPMVEDYLIGKLAPTAAGVQALYLNEDGEWKP